MVLFSSRILSTSTCMPVYSARDCWPRRRCVWPFSCWICLPGSTPLSTICIHRPMPNFMRQRRSVAHSSLVQPGDGVKFHRDRASPILGPAVSAMARCSLRSCEVSCEVSACTYAVRCWQGDSN